MSVLNNMRRGIHQGSKAIKVALLRAWMRAEEKRLIDAEIAAGAAIIAQSTAIDVQTEAAASIKLLKEEIAALTGTEAK
jgi:hypothetical protein